VFFDLILRAHAHNCVVIAWPKYTRPEEFVSLGKHASGRQEARSENEYHQLSWAPSGAGEDTRQ
jgi:hypothetical protein